MKNIGIDIGASHISCGLYNIDSHLLENRIYTRYEADMNLDLEISTKNFITIIIKLIDKIILDSNLNIEKIGAIGIGCPGLTDNTDGIFYGSSTLQVGKVNFRAQLQKYNTKILVENDCTCAGICESYFNNLNNFIMLTLGSDVGISYMQNFKCINEIVWDIISINKISSNSSDRYIESFAYLAHEYSMLKNKNCKRREFFTSLKDGDIIAKNLIDKYVHNFVYGVKKIQAKYEFSNIVIGGGMSEYSAFFINKIQRGLPDLKVITAKYNNDAGIIGAALLENLPTNNM